MVKIHNIITHEFCIWGTDSTVKENFYSGQAGCFGTSIMWVRYLVTTNIYTNTARLGFLRAVRHNDTGV
jgi:hypothetical protein